VRRELVQGPVTIIGGARSGLAAAKLIAANGGMPFISDLATQEKLGPAVAALQEAGVAYEVGGHTEKVFGARLIVISPGVPSSSPVVAEAAKRGIPVVSELELASWFCPGPIAAITGSNGKTTTTTLVGRMLGDARLRHTVAGNIGTAFSGVVGTMAPDEWAVLEVSSFQLDHCETFRPTVSVLLNITPDHMDRYGNLMERYAASKARIFQAQGEGDTLIYGADDLWTARVIAQAKCRTLPFGMVRGGTDGAWVEDELLIASVDGTPREIIRADEISIKGRHNVQNAMAATLVGLLCGVSPASLRATLRNFKGVEHRLEFVREVQGVRYYNDSKATNVDSVWYALQSFASPIVLLIGGRDKGNDYSHLHQLVQERVKAVVAIGESADKVAAAFNGMAVIKKASSMEEAVSTARFVADVGDVVLLSPACASFDWFENYEHRGRVFKELVNAL
jgi:UDP-N-acetylmuramoylalanine--D-glutamate ligase